MRLGWNEIRARAAKFSEEWKDAHYEKGETQSFYNEFFEVFGVRRRRVANFEHHLKKLNNESGFVDLFWPGTLLIEQKSAGRNLTKAKEQAHDYCINLKDGEHPRYILVSDFQNFSLYDLEAEEKIEEETHFSLADLHKHVEKFGFIVGVVKHKLREEDPVNIRASEMMGHIHDDLKKAGYGEHDLELFLVRLLFCLFADDTGIFARDIFLDFLTNRTQEDGSDLGAKIAHLFQVLDTPEDKRQDNLDEDLAAFPYVNGDLFKKTLRIPAFDSALRTKLITACQFDWGKVSPAIFGSLFQSVMNPEERRQQGAHYTSERDILKLINPLFMDELRAEFERLKKLKTNRQKRLVKFHGELARPTFFDPACGCGNFLVIAYRELRRLEIELLQAIYKGGQQYLNMEELSIIDVDQFYGIELDEFASRIAETALWMMDHIMNNELSLAFGKSFVRIPLKKSPHIHHADALETDWHTVLPSEKCDYVFGNPPFSGQSYQSKEQREQMRQLIDSTAKRAPPLDYVTSWFLKAGDYVQTGKSKIAFVATNSITQGEQVGMLWPLLLDRYKLEISFAHRPFMWQSEARGKAHVHVVIIGLTRADMQPKEKRLFSYPDIKGNPEESRHKALSPYLFDASKLNNKHLVVKDTANPIDKRPKMGKGAQATDGGHYIFRGKEYDDFLKLEPKAKKYMRPYIGGQEFIKGKSRWILFLRDIAPDELKTMPHVMERVKKVKEMRLASKKLATQKLAQYPTHLEGKTIPNTPFLIMPRVSSERREYIPIGYMTPPTIPSDATTFAPNATLDLFGILTSTMHMTWMRTVAGRLESRYMYSVGIVYNTFPMPKMTDKQKQAIASKAQAVLDARANHAGASLADLYDPDTMPPDLLRAHQALDKAVEKLYRKTPFQSERERVEHLFALYEQLTKPPLPI